MTEEWRPAPGLPKYEVSSLGQVRYGATGRVRKLTINNKGYPILSVWSGDQHRPGYFLVHRLVCAAFHGECPPDFECAHLSGDRSDPRAENLKWVSAAENHAHRIAHGTTARGAKSANAKLTKDDVRGIIEAARDGVSQRSLARYYNVGQCSVHRVISGKGYINERQEFGL